MRRQGLGGCGRAHQEGLAQELILKPRLEGTGQAEDRGRMMGNSGLG